MSANIYKRFNVSDTFVVPYTANKSWDIDSGSFADNRIVVNIGVNKSGSIFDPNTEFITNGQYERLVYNSINLNYYPNFLPTSSHLYLTERQGTAFNDGTLSTQSYYNGFINPGNLDTVKFFPTASDSVIYVVNTPKTLTSEKILPSTFELYFSSGSTYTAKIYDDGNYNLFYSGSSVASSIGSTLTNGSYIGNVFYEQNVAVLTIIPNAVRLLGWRGANPYCIQASPSPTPSITPSISISVTPSITHTVTPSVTPSVSITPSISVTPSMTPSISITPSVTPSISATPSISVTPSLTPSVTPTLPAYVYAGTTSNYANAVLACNNKTCGRAWYRNAPSWSIGQIVYNDINLTTPYNGGGNWIAVATSIGTYCGGGWAAIQVDSSGVILDFISCP
jgi:hypothetical protein